MIELECMKEVETYNVLWYHRRADSVTWNPHKLMGTLLQCSTVHFKDEVSLSLYLLVLATVYYSMKPTAQNQHSFSHNFHRFP